MVEIIQKDLFDCKCMGYAHQINAHAVWGMGLAKEMKKRFPRAWKVDSMTLVHEKRKLGTFNYTAPADDTDKWIFNLCAQYNYGFNNKQHTDYEALNQSLESLKNFLHNMFDYFTLAIPYGLGAGLGNGDFKIILGMINYIFAKDEKIKVLICQKT